MDDWNYNLFCKGSRDSQVGKPKDRIFGQNPSYTSGYELNPTPLTTQQSSKDRVFTFMNEKKLISFDK